MMMLGLAVYLGGVAASFMPYAFVADSASGGHALLRGFGLALFWPISWVVIVVEVKG